MARTKKQTIDAASARKRQIQEEILNESLALLGKRENIKSSSTEATNQKSDSAKSKTSPNTTRSRENSLIWPSTDSSGIRKSSENVVDFPKAVICITDIYKTSPELLDSAGVKLSKNCSSVKSDAGCSRKLKYENLKLNVCEPMDANSETTDPSSSSPARFKSRSEATPEQSPKHLGKSYSLSINSSGMLGRRSPRRQLPATVGSLHAQASHVESCMPPKSEKQKINIFTDNLGVDLGKRIRSPRRLSEDMIALPIYSMRRAGNSPKEHLVSSKNQEHENSLEISPKRSSLCGSSSESHPSGQSVNPLASNYLASQVSVVREGSLKKSKFQGKRLQSVTVRDSFSIQEKEKSKMFNSESLATCDNSKISPSRDKGKKEVELLMSSICKDIIGEVASENEYLFKKMPKRSDNNQSLESVNKRSNCKLVEVVSSVNGNKQINSSDSQTTKKMRGEESASPLHNGKVTNTKEQASSLLCAMLVGGTDVAQDYSQKKEKLKPDAADIPDKKVDQSDIMSSDTTIDKSTEKLLSTKVEKKSEIHASFCDKEEVADQKDVSLSSIVELTNKEDEGCEENASFESKFKNEEIDTDLTVEVYKGSEFHKLSKDVDNDEIPNVHEKEPSQQCSDSSANANKDEEDPKAWKKSKIDFSSQLKKLNENILKLVDIDVEEEFLTLPDNCSGDGPSKAHGEPELSTELYSLISSLGHRLKENVSKCTESSESCESDSIDQLIQSCPKGRQQIVTSSGEAVWNKVLERLKQDENKSDNTKNESGPVPLLSDDFANSGSGENSDEHSSHVCSDAKDLNDVKPSHEDSKVGSLSDVREKEAGCETPPPGDRNTQGLYSTGSSSSHHGSLCELDVDEMTAATAAVLKKPGYIMDDSPQNANISVSKIETETTNEDLLKHSSDILVKRPLQKAMTCSDFSSSPESKTLRRSSSSPQLYKNMNLPSTSSLMSSSSYEEGECINKSKLGSKIPIPGTVFSSRFYKKSWRTPRIIMNPKPLEILLQLETEGPNKDIFVSRELQKYLWMPSSRMIVTSAIREEIKRADETAQKAWETKSLFMKDEDENSRKKEDDEEVNKNFSKHEPDFDEVEGMLFMSFSNEIELKAHIHVEKALEWDKDDTMLRISRAKIFEETKAVNGNMREVKMKRLRGQHMRWKKYKRMYSKEVDTLLDAKEKGIPLDQVNSFRKTSDITKIKGWKNKPAVTRDLSEQCRNRNLVHDMENRQNFVYPRPISPYEEKIQTTHFVPLDIKESLSEKKKDLSPKSRRQFNFSDRKAHRQLFKELNMDWEDRMIHRKLGGWSLKGNRPKAFSGAAIKRKKREMKNMLSPNMNEGFGDIITDVRQVEPHSEVSPGVGVTESHSDVSPGGGVNTSPRKRKLVYPMLTEKLARKCLKTLETGDILKALRRKKKRKRLRRAALCHLPALTPMPPLIGETLSKQAFSTPVSSNIKEEWTSLQTQIASSAPSVTSPLNLDLPDETVLEGVDIASRISSPSVTDVQSSPQVKACSKPGCRYGCICHLCSVNESPTPSESFSFKSPIPACDKEYCRLGCICDSLDPEQPTSTQAHCGKPCCMLECICSDSGLPASQVEGSDDIPFLPSMKQRPRAGERFSNLPRREKTHRTAKNLDAVTRKALMLYETSEIFCERVEKTKKKESFDFPPHTFKASFDQPEVELIELDEAFNHERHFPQTLEPTRQKRKYPVFTNIDVEMTDVVQSVPVMEPSAHKRKRKSHPLSNEIFTLSTCARIQPYVTKKYKQEKLMADPSVQNVTSSMLLMAGSSHFNSKEQAQSELKIADVQSNGPVSSQSDLKITNVTSLTSEAKLDEKREKVSEHIDLTEVEDSHCHNYHQTALKPLSGPISSIVPDSAKKLGISNQPGGEDQAHHGWHTSMVCLKAKAPSKNEIQNEDDIQEEDEVKLLEFAADCNWDGSKRAILAQVASCLTRGHYPQPRTMNINEFVVEILPKAQQPTVIPPALRAKLPEQMYSIRVRITRRYDPAKAKLLSPPLVSETTIDLCGPSPKKNQSISASPVTPSSSQLIFSANNNTSLSNTLSFTSSTSSHIGISSLSNLHVTSTGKRSSESAAKSNSSESTTKSKSAPGSRRSSIDMQKYDFKINSADDTSVSLTTVDTKYSNKPTYSSVKSILPKTEGKTVSTSEVKLPTTLSCGKSKVQSTSSVVSTLSATPKVFSPLVQPLKFISSSPSLLKTPSKAAGSRKGKQVKSVVPATINAPNAAILKPVNPKDLKYVQLPNKEPLMVYEVDVKTDKKTLIAVPLSLAGMTGDIKGKPILTVPVPAAGQQKVLPLIASRPKVTDESSPQFLKLKSSHTPPQSVFVKIPCVNPSVVLPSEQLSKSHGLVNILPVTVQNTSLKQMNIAKPVPIASKPTQPSATTSFNGVLESKVVNISSPSALKPKNVKSNPLSLSTTVTQSRDRPIPSSEVSPVKKDFPKETVPSSVSLSKSKDSQYSKPEDGSTTSKFVPLTIPISSELSQQDSKSIGNISVKDSESKGMLEQAKSSLSTNDAISGDAGFKKNNASSEKDVLHNSTEQEVCPVNDQNTHINSETLDANKICAPASSSSHSSGPISEDESFSGFSVMKDIFCPAFSSHSQSYIGLELNKNSQNPAIQTEEDGCRKEYVKIASSSPSHQKRALPNSKSLAPKSSLLRIPSAEVIIDNEPCLKESSQDASENVLKRDAEDGCIEVDIPESKRPKMMGEYLPAGEDEINIPNTSSPHSSCSRPKSGLSSVLSSGSSEDLIVNLSSEEEIDVGEDSPADAFVTIKEQMERAWENDHSTMYCKAPQVAASTTGSKGHFHKYLERARRAKLKELFNQLADTVTSIPGMKFHLQNRPDGCPMPKAMILESAKRSIEHLEQVLDSDEMQISQLVAQNESLKRELQNTKADLLTKNVSGRAIAAIVNRISRQAKMFQEKIALPVEGTTDEVDGGPSQNDSPVSITTLDSDTCGKDKEPGEEKAPSNQEESLVTECENVKESERIDVSDHETVPEEVALSESEEVYKSSSVPKYEDISDWENGASTSQEPIPQYEYEDITDEENDS